MTLYEEKDSYKHGETRETTRIYLIDILLDIENLVLFIYE